MSEPALALAPESVPLSPYINEAGSAANHTERLTTKVAALVLGLGSVRAVAGGSAADFQHMASGMAAAARVTGQSMESLSAGTRQLQRDFPMATKEALATVQAVQSLGLTSKNQVNQVAQLSTVMAKLGGATGTAPSQIAQSFGQLNREMASLDPARVQRFGDSLTTLSARSGSSAQGIVNFAQSISPFAQAAGVGETALLGISTAFSKLGNDGYVAANTVNTMFSELTKSVRDGGNQMAAYATILGTTTKQARQLYNASPANFIGQVTQKIGTSGAQGGRMLESIGIEGIRGQRALLMAAQSGGLSAEIRRSERAFGSGSTENAQQVAYSGVTDQLTRLSSASQQVAEAFERPLLNSVSNLVKATAGITHGVGGVVDSGPVQRMLGIGAKIGVPLAIGHIASHAVTTGATGAFFLRSGPVTGLFAGIRAGRRGGSAQAALEDVPRTQPVANMLATMDFNQQQQQLAAAGMPHEEELPLGRKGTAAVNAKAVEAGGFIGAAFPKPAPGGRSILGMARGYGVAATGMVLRSQSELLRLARLDPQDREIRMRGFTQPHQIFAASMHAHGQELQAGNIDHPTYLRNLGKELDKLAESSKGAKAGISEIGKGLAAVAGQGIATGAKGAKAGLIAGAGGLLSGLMSPAGLITAGITGGTMAYSHYQNMQASHKAAQEASANVDPYEGINRYRDALGEAGLATQNFAQTVNDAANNLQQTEGRKKSTATTVSEADISASVKATGGSGYDWDSKKLLHTYRGTDKQIAGQVSALNLNGMSSQDLQAVKMDLLNHPGMTPDRVQNIMDLVGADKGAGKGRMSQAQMEGLVGGVASANRTYRPGLNESKPTGAFAWTTVGRSSTPQVGEQGKRILSQVDSTLKQQFGLTADRYGAKYAVVDEMKTGQNLVQTALRQKNAAAAVTIAQRVAGQLTGGKAVGLHITAADLQQYHGDVAKYLADNTDYKMYGHDAGYWQGQKGMARPVVQPRAEYRTAKSVGASVFEDMFGKDELTGPGQERARITTQKALDRPENLSLQTRAAEQMVGSSLKAGVSLEKLAGQAVRLGGAFADGSHQQQMAARVLAQTQFRMTTQLQGATRGQTWQAQSQMGLALAGTNGNSQWAQQQREQGKQMLQQVRGDQISYYQQRLQAQMQFQIASERSNEDYQLNVRRSEHDFHLNRRRATEDFNLQMRRAAEDSAKTLYDPYTRIAVQPVYSSSLLIGNSQEQIQAMRTQLANLKKLRSMGLDEATIRMLGLYAPDKAQQTQELVMDLQGNQREINQLNKQTEQRQRLGGRLLSEDPTYQRQRDDFKKQQRRQNTDFQTQSDRAHYDYLKSQRRMMEDVHLQDLEMTNDLKALQKGMNEVLHGQLVDFSNIAESTLKDTLKTVDKYAPKIHHSLAHPAGTGGGSGGGIGSIGARIGGGHSGTRAQIGTRKGLNPGDPDMPNYGKKGSYLGPQHPGNESYKTIERMGRYSGLNPTASPGLNDPPGTHVDGSYHGKGKAVDFTFPGNDPDKLRDLDQFLAANYGHMLEELIYSGPGNVCIKNQQQVDGRSVYSSVWGSHKTHVHVAADPASLGLAGGGIVTAERTTKLREAGTDEAVIPLNQYGVGVLARALGQYMSAEDATVLGGGGGRSFALHIDNSQHFYDQGQHITGPVTVKANTTAEWAAQSRAATRQRNLTATRGVRWSKP